MKLFVKAGCEASSELIEFVEEGGYHLEVLPLPKYGYVADCINGLNHAPCLVTDAERIIYNLDEIKKEVERYYV